MAILNKALVRGTIESNENGNRIIINPKTRSINMYNQVDGIDFEILNISFEDVGFGLMRPKIEMKEYSTSDGSVMATTIVSSKQLGMYRYGDLDNPFFEIAGDRYSQKRIKIGEIALPSTKPETNRTLWKDGEYLKITD